MTGGMTPVTHSVAVADRADHGCAEQDGRGHLQPVEHQSRAARPPRRMKAMPSGLSIGKPFADQRPRVAPSSGHDDEARQKRDQHEEAEILHDGDGGDLRLAVGRHGENGGQGARDGGQHRIGLAPARDAHEPAGGCRGDRHDSDHQQHEAARISPHGRDGVGRHRRAHGGARDQHGGIGKRLRHGHGPAGEAPQRRGDGSARQPRGRNAEPVEEEPAECGDQDLGEMGKDETHETLLNGRPFPLRQMPMLRSGHAMSDCRRCGLIRSIARNAKAC